MTDSELLDWLENHILTDHRSDQFPAALRSIDWNDADGRRLRTTGTNLRDCIHKALANESTTERDREPWKTQFR
jgi:hypothetical protein